MTDELVHPQRHAEVLRLISSFDTNPAFVYDRHLTVLLANSLAPAIAPGFAVGSNLARFTFLPAVIDTDVRDWIAKRDQVAGLLKDLLDRHREDSEYLDLVGQLATVSPEFASAWADQPAAQVSGDFLFSNPLTGEFRLEFNLFPLGNDRGETLAVWNAFDATASTALNVLSHEARGGREAHVT